MSGPSRRWILGRGSLGMGAFALAPWFARAAQNPLVAAASGEHWRLPEARAKRVIVLHMAGGPSQIELFDPKPVLAKHDGEVVPPSFVEGKRFAFIGKDAKLMASKRGFVRNAKTGVEIGALLPHIGGIADKFCLIRSMQTDEINHGPAKLFFSTGHGRVGRPSLGAWLSWGLGSEADDLPAFVVMTSGPRGPRAGAPLWGPGFLPARHQGTPLRQVGAPILHLDSPAGFEGERQADFFAAVDSLNRARPDAALDRGLQGRLAAYELAARMQASAPELVDLSSETPETLALYGCDPAKPSFARNCLLARRLVERGVRCVHMYHTDWDHHGDPNLHLGEPLDEICGQVDRPSAALVLDLERRGLLQDTIVVWGGEFGRTPMSEVRARVGRDHHIQAYTMWVAGGGFRAGHVHGRTDDIGFSVAEDPVHVHDLQATLLHQLGIDHEKFTFRSQGRDFRLTDVAGEVVPGLLG